MTQIAIVIVTFFTFRLIDVLLAIPAEIENRKEQKRQQEMAKEEEEENQRIRRRRRNTLLGASDPQATIRRLGS